MICVLNARSKLKLCAILLIAVNREPYCEWRTVNRNDYAEQLEAGTAIEKRFSERTGIIETQDAGQPQQIDSTAAGNCRAMLRL